MTYRGQYMNLQFWPIEVFLDSKTFETLSCQIGCRHMPLDGLKTVNLKPFAIPSFVGSVPIVFSKHTRESIPFAIHLTLLKTEDAGLWRPRTR